MGPYQSPRFYLQRIVRAITLAAMLWPATLAAQSGQENPGQPNELIISAGHCPPFVISENGEFNGLGIFLWQQIAAKIGVTYELRNVELAEMLDAEVYVNANLGTGSPREMAAWLEYMTSPSDSTLANERRTNGRDKPWKVHYFAIGNESWGCGGTMRPQYYADLYKHWATFAKTPADNQPIMIASGGHTDQTEWTETLLKEVPETWSLRMNAISHHYLKGLSTPISPLWTSTTRTKK